MPEQPLGLEGPQEESVGSNNECLPWQFGWCPVVITQLRCESCQLEELKTFVVCQEAQL